MPIWDDSDKAVLRQLVDQTAANVAAMTELREQTTAAMTELREIITAQAENISALGKVVEKTHDILREHITQPHLTDE